MKTIEALFRHIMFEPTISPPLQLTSSSSALEKGVQGEEKTVLEKECEDLIKETDFDYRAFTLFTTNMIYLLGGYRQNRIHVSEWMVNDQTGIATRFSEDRMGTGIQLIPSWRLILTEEAQRELWQNSMEPFVVEYLDWPTGDDPTLSYQAYGPPKCSQAVTSHITGEVILPIKFTDMKGHLKSFTSPREDQIQQFCQQLFQNYQLSTSSVEERS